jgi:hypothetical protein
MMPLRKPFILCDFEDRYGGHPSQKTAAVKNFIGRACKYAKSEAGLGYGRSL